MRQIIELGKTPSYQPDNGNPLGNDASSLAGDAFNSHTRSNRSDLTLRALYANIDECDEIIRHVRADIAFMDNGDVAHQILRSIIERLGKLSLFADCWHFEELYWAAFQMQQRLLELEAVAQIPRTCSEKTLDNGMEMLARILHECENNYRLRLSMADVLEDIATAENI